MKTIMMIFTTLVSLSLFIFMNEGYATHHTNPIHHIHQAERKSIKRHNHKPNNKQSNKQLEQLNNQIASMKAKLTIDKQHREQLEHDLQKTETVAGKLHNEIKKTETSINKHQSQLSMLQSTEKIQNKKLIHQQELLSKQVHIAYMFGNRSYLRLLLNQQDPSAFGRILTYDGYIAQNQQQIIADLRSTIKSIHSNQHQIQNQNRILTHLAQVQNNKRKQIELTNKNRRQLIQNISGTIKMKNQKLEKLIEDKHRLEQMLARLEAQARAQSRMLGPLLTGKFGKLQNRLAWPTKGTILNRFGTPIEQSELKWNGVLIKAPKGQPVYNIANGKVVFAKWLSGYGLLMIIYHGDGYMSLYGRNQNLYKQEGDNVRPGELIASVGDTGGFQAPALYFAIRHNAIPLNPQLWCR